LTTSTSTPGSFFKDAATTDNRTRALSYPLLADILLAYSLPYRLVFHLPAVPPVLTPIPCDLGLIWAGLGPLTGPLVVLLGAPGGPGVGVLNAAVGAGGVLGSLVAFTLVRRGGLATWFGIGIALFGAPLALIGAIPQQAAAIVRSYDTGVTLRQLFYRLVAAHLLPNTTTAYKGLSSQTAEARRAGR